MTSNGIIHILNYFLYDVEDDVAATETSYNETSTNATSSPNETLPNAASHTATPQRTTSNRNTNTSKILPLTLFNFLNLIVYVMYLFY